ALRRAVNLDAVHPEAAVNLGVMLCKNKHYKEAIPILQQAIKLSPGFNDAHANLARAYAMTQQAQLADKQYQVLLQTVTPSPETLSEVAELYHSEGRFAEVLEIIARLQSYSEREEKIDRLTMTLCSTIGWKKNADSQYEKCSASDGRAETHFLFSLAQYYAQQNLAVEADAQLTQLIAINPDDTIAHWNRALQRLTSGRLIDGFDEYSWRFKSDGVIGEHQFKKPEWQGENLNGKYILIHGEQGAGDIIQFMRYLKFVEQRGGSLLFESGKAVWDLFSDEDENDMQVESNQPTEAQLKPDFAVHIPLMSLPKVFKTTLETIPWDGAYVHASEKKSAYWKNKLGEHQNLRIGIVWGGNPEHKNDHNRSCRLSDFSKLATIPGIKWYSIQKGKPESQALAPPHGMELINLSGDIRDFSDTAAIIDNLDLAISVDTSVVHLAGAMDKPAWVLLAFNPDWRWLLDRSDSPWYPSLTLFRQKQFGDWDSVFEQVYQSLTALVKQRFEQAFNQPALVKNNLPEPFDADVMDLRSSLEDCDALIGQNQLEPASSLLDKLQVNFSGCADVKVRQACVAAKKNNTSAAIALSEAALIIDPDCPEAVKQLAQLYAENKNYQAAMKVLQQHLRCRPLDVEGWKSLSEIYRQQGNEYVANFFAERVADLISQQEQNKAVAR
ncbi:MAG: tetratricopeptide repeat protein, partial [Burkholderiales bacterium]